MNTLNTEKNINLDTVDQVIASIGQVLLGKQTQIKLALACILARGHLLIEDMPGMGKTTLAQAMADVLGLDYKRVQFTSDLLPADLLGLSIFNKQQNAFEFHRGPIFTQLLLADEINRASAKTQSALLEAMEEQQVSIEGETRLLADPFFVIATQNPSNYSGTYSLPESQLDRFTMRISLGFPSREAERTMLLKMAHKEVLSEQGSGRTRLAAQLSRSQLKELQQQVVNVSVSDHLLDYVQRLISFSREDSQFNFGVSPRGSMALLYAAKAWALIEKRDYLLPEDIQQVFPSVIGHRLSAASSAGNSEQMSRYILEQVDVLY